MITALRHRKNKHAAAMAAAYWNKPLANRGWYRIDASADTAEILIYDVVGWPFIEAEQFVRDLARIDADEITVRINSPGGDVFDGMAIYNALKVHKARIVASVDSLAASMASVIALAGDEVRAHRNAMYMVHEPYMLTMGNQHELRADADDLAKITDNMVDIYAGKSGKDAEAVRELLLANNTGGTFLKAAEALDFGFVDTVIDDPAAQAQAAFSRGDIDMLNDLTNKLRRK